MRNCLSYMGMAVAFVNITGMVGCARGREPEVPQPLAGQYVEIPAPNAADSAAAQQNLSEAWSVYWKTQYAKAKAEMCKP